MLINEGIVKVFTMSGYSMILIVTFNINLSSILVIHDQELETFMSVYIVNVIHH